MPRERDENTGQFEEQYPASSFLTAIDALENATTTQIAEEVECSYDLAYRKLNELEDDGEVRNQKIGNTLLWESRD